MKIYQKYLVMMKCYGWWLEGYREGAGWALTEKRTYQNQEHQDQLDAATIYSILETEILPLYYARNKKGYSEGWIKVCLLYTSRCV